MATGTPMMSAIALVIRVPTSSGHAPKVSFETSQLLSKVKPRTPNFESAGFASEISRAKKYAIKSVLETGQTGLRIQHLLDSIVDEFAENEDLPNTTNPDDWARISGKKGERIVYIRTLVSGGKTGDTGRAIDTVSNTGQYL